MSRANTDPFQDSLYRPDLDQPVVDRVAEVAAARGDSPAQVALAWLLHKPGVTAPIVGATREAHVADALAAEELSLSDDEIRRLEERPAPGVGHRAPVGPPRSAWTPSGRSFTLHSGGARSPSHPYRGGLYGRRQGFAPARALAGLPPLSHFRTSAQPTGERPG